MVNVNMGSRLRTLRKSKNLTLKEVSQIVGVSVSTLSSYEIEDRHPSYDVLLKLTRLYNVTCDYIISGECNQKTIDVTNLSVKEIQTISDLISLLKENK